MKFALTLALLSTLLSGSASARPITHHSRSDAYDYIIVGGGNAGLVVASRLSENPDISVLVLEAGHEYNYNHNVTVPGLDLTVTYGSSVDWNYTTQPEAHLNNRIINYPRGFVLGGSSSTNFMAYTRGCAAGYDAWEALGNAGWGWSDVVKYFKKSTRFHEPLSDQSYIVYDASAYDTPSEAKLDISYGRYVEPASKLFVDALADYFDMPQVEINDGYPMANPSQGGSTYLPLTIDPDTASRDSSYTAFGADAQSRSNLHILTGALVSSLTFDSPSGTTVTGVTYLDSSNTAHSVTASREVVLSAGAFGSPQLLMLSGIGPSDELASLDIPVRVANDAVGKSMVDHLLFGPYYEVASNVTSSDQFLFNSTAFNVLEQQYEELPPRGEFTGAISSMSAYERIPDNVLDTYPKGGELKDLDSSWPHIQLEVIAGGLPPNTSAGGNYVNPAGVLLYPFSQGQVTLSSSSIHDRAHVSPNWLSDPTDQQAAIWAFKQVRSIWTSPTMAGSVLREAWPGEHLTSDADILDAIRSIAHPIYQASSTCSMRPRDDGGVVDPQLRVYGTQNLRVIDNSITPIIPSANTMAVSYMIGEHGADLIKNDRQESQSFRRDIALWTGGPELGMYNE